MNYRTIPLTKGFVTIVDEDDYDWLNQWKWFCSPQGYAIRNDVSFRTNGYRNRKTIRIHRLIINPQKWQHVDHINGDRLDNRRVNLRVCTDAQNQYNQKPIRGGTSKYKGVCWDKKTKKWLASISIYRKKIRLGRYILEEDAALAYNNAAEKLYGNFARLNILDGEVESRG